MKPRLHISLAFGDIILPIADCEDGHKRVPLKPICDQIGLNWTSQKTKLQKDGYLNSLLGLEYRPYIGSVLSPKAGNPNHLCIRIDRVAAFLLQINPNKVRAKGNEDTALWLEAKHREWCDVLHAYESSINGIFGKQKSTGIKQLSELYKLRKNASSLKEKATIQRMINAQFADMGHDLDSIQKPQDELPLQDAG